MGAHRQKPHTTAEELRGRQKAREAIQKAGLQRRGEGDLELVIEDTFGTVYPPNENDPPVVGEMYSEGCCE